MVECPKCEGGGEIDGETCEMCDGNGEIEVRGLEEKIEAEMKEIEKEELEEKELKAACSCGGDKMTKEQRAEAISALVADKHSGFTAADEKMLEAASDERIEAFRVAAAARAKEVETPKVAEAKPLSQADWLAAAPEEFRTLITRQQAQDTAYKASMVASLKTAQSEYPESELAAMPIADLERLTRVCKVAAPPVVDYSGRGIPVPRAAESKEDVYSNPPDSYEEGLKALRAASVN